MKALRKKLIRDCLRLRAQAIAIALVAACGVATFVMSVSVLRSLERMADRHYDRFRFAQVFAQARRVPNALAARLAELPGVTAAQTRVVVEATLDMPGMIEPAVGRLVSIPDRDEPALNRLHLRRGRWPDPDRRGEVLVNEAFAVAHDLAPGDGLAATLNGRRERLTVAGVALSPEYVYQIRGGDLLPDDRRFGVLWMRERPLAAAFDLEHAFNDVALTIRRGADEAEVIAGVDTLLAPYGGRGAYGRAEQVSHRYVSDELTQLRGMALVPPTIFLLVTAFTLNVAINRVIAMQREQIATLRAFGYTPAEIARHYLGMALLIVVAGFVIGTLVGWWLGSGLTDLYVRFFRFPEREYRIEPFVPLLAGILSLGAGALGVGMAVRRVARLAPAEAMRPEAPAAYRAAWFERPGARWRPGPAGMMVFRQIGRKPLRAAFSILGLALGVAVMILGSFGRDMIDYVVDFQFGATQRHDYRVTFVEPTSAAALGELARLPGVLRAEPFRAVPVRLVHGPRSRRTAVTGLVAEGELTVLRDADGLIVPLPAEGLLLSEKLAESLGVRPGDALDVEVLEGARPTRGIEVAATLRDFSGLAVYCELGALNRLLREGRAISGAFLQVDSAREAALHARIKETPRVADVTSQRAALRSFRALMEENMLRMRLFNVVFAGIIAFGVVYNAARVTLSERARELATLRIVGLTRGEVFAVLTGEIALLTACAAPIGLWLGNGLARFAVRALETETQRFPFVIAPATYAGAIATVVIATVISCLAVRRRIEALDLAAALKACD